MTRSRSLWLQWIHAERGALLWVPALWAAAALVLFGIVQATTERSFFNHTLDLRLALGPMDVDEVEATEGQVFLETLRRELKAQRGFTLMSDEVVQRRVVALLGTPLPPDPQRWMRATRNLNVSVYLTARLARRREDLQASLVLWNVGTEEPVARFSTSGHTASRLGQALADSVGRALFSPPGALQATR